MGCAWKRSWSTRASRTPWSSTGITVEVVRRNPDDEGKGFVPQPKRWVVEQVTGTLMLQRRLARDYDHRPDNAASRVYWASTAGMLRRLTTLPPPGVTT